MKDEKTKIRIAIDNSKKNLNNPGNASGCSGFLFQK